MAFQISRFRRCSEQPAGPHFGPPGTSWGSFWASWSFLGLILGFLRPPGAYFGPPLILDFLRPPGAHCGPPGASSRGLLELILGHLGFILNLLGPPGAQFGLPELISGFLKPPRVHSGPPAPGSYERSRAQAAPERDGQTAREDKGDGAPRGLYCPRPAHEAKSKKQRYHSNE
jgi:hypothetical protein